MTAGTDWGQAHTWSASQREPHAPTVTYRGGDQPPSADSEPDADDLLCMALGAVVALIVVALVMVP
jgi:hypothetical protein